jgi:hypothetical protein
MSVGHAAPLAQAPPVMWLGGQEMSHPQCPERTEVLANQAFVKCSDRE